MLQGLVRLGLDRLLNHMVLGDGQDRRRIMLELLRAARRGGSSFPVRQKRAWWPLDHRRDRRCFLSDTGSAYEGLVAYKRRGQGGLGRLLGRAGDNRDGNDRNGGCQGLGRWWGRGWGGDGHQQFAPGLLQGNGTVRPWHAGLAGRLLLLLPLQAELLVLLILL